MKCPVPTITKVSFWDDHHIYLPNSKLGLIWTGTCSLFNQTRVTDVVSVTKCFIVFAPKPARWVTGQRGPLFVGAGNRDKQTFGADEYGNVRTCLAS